MTGPLPPDDDIPRPQSPDDIPPDATPWPDGPPPPPTWQPIWLEGSMPSLEGAVPPVSQPDPVEIEAQRKTLRTIIISLAVGSLLFRILRATHQEHGALVFIGIPTALALLVASSAPAKSITGTVMKVITLALLMSAIAFGEATVCILFAAPLLYAVGFIVGKLAEVFSREPKPGRFYVVVALFIPLSLEGVVPGTGFERNATLTIEREVAATPDAVRATLAAPMDFGRELPPFLRLGFPTPGATSGEGLEPGSRRTIAFAHGHHPGTLALEVSRAESRADGGTVVFLPVGDDSYITHWLSWRGANVHWEAVAPGRTRVRWTLYYRRRLDPAWYFAPLERYGVHAAAGYLLETLTTPHDRAR